MTPWQIALFLVGFFGAFGVLAFWLVRPSKRAENDPKVAQRVAKQQERRYAKERATAEPYLPDLEASDHARRFSATAQRWGWRQPVRVEAGRHRYDEKLIGGERRTVRTNSGPLASLIAAHPKQPIEVRWHFEHDKQHGWAPDRAELWVLDAPFGFEDIGLLQSHESAEPEDPEQLLSRLARGLPRSAWTACAAIFAGTTLYVDADARQKSELCDRWATESA